MEDKRLWTKEEIEAVDQALEKEFGKGHFKPCKRGKVESDKYYIYAFPYWSEDAHLVEKDAEGEFTIHPPGHSRGGPVEGYRVPLEVAIQDLIAAYIDERKFIGPPVNERTDLVALENWVADAKQTIATYCGKQVSELTDGDYVRFNDETCGFTQERIRKLIEIYG